VIGTDVGSIRDLIIDGETGFIVPPDDVDALAAKISWIRSHTREASTLALRGRSLVEREFAADAIGDSFLQAIRARGAALRSI
jgi:glycosyltransferase involved in cell wall biosynthesis